VILEEADEGTFDRGTATKKLVHQLSSTGDPVFNLKVPASRIVGGYTVKDGVIVPNFNPTEIIDAVFRRTRVPVGLMTAAKLLSAVEPVIRYQRQRFRGAEGAKPGSVRYEQGIQQREDALHRLVDIWAAGEAAASLGFAAARLFDALDPLEKQKTAILKEQGVYGGRADILPTPRRGATNCSPIRWCIMCSPTRKPTYFAPPPSSGTPATAPT
jgi:alkylation response protein AidB-like acyl-CoA dehydrogenase